MLREQLHLSLGSSERTSSPSNTSDVGSSTYPADKPQLRFCSAVGQRSRETRAKQTKTLISDEVGQPEPSRSQKPSCPWLGTQNHPERYRGRPPRHLQPGQVRLLTPSPGCPPTDPCSSGEPGPEPLLPALSPHPAPAPVTSSANTVPAKSRLGTRCPVPGSPAEPQLRKGRISRQLSAHGTECPMNPLPGAPSWSVHLGCLLGPTDNHGSFSLPDVPTALAARPWRHQPSCGQQNGPPSSPTRPHVKHQRVEQRACCSVLGCRAQNPLRPTAARPLTA